ncbi:DNA gyrase/topoisomerase IV subunit A [Prochlorothrix hollandica]|uniref:DNA gyrase/topoisomerase IV subunit A n=1 Tax=Prochlorothrix hollandica TaxID=1223 RepID=UPI003340180E
MADPLNVLGTERIVSTALHQEMQRSYLEYAMSVIVGRALPDVRDGLKPVQRRILYAMHELGLVPDRPFRKCARVVGDVLGKYHPHGDQAVYDALVRLVQDFSCRYPLLAGHGNFGSVDNDPPAAMRYTETRLAPISHGGMLGEIGEETVDFAANFDNSQQEPVVLPAQLPFLLLNGCSGIAVGMATNIPPHNLGEIIDGLVALIDRPDLPDANLLKLIPGPDFPTGGQVMGQEGIEEAYTQGKGSITVRGVATVEQTQPGRGRHRRTAIIVTELPYQVNKAAWIEKMAALANQEKLEGIADIRDESDRDGMRVVIELRREANPAQVLQDLHQKTPLQTTFGAIFLALVDGQPRQLSLKQVLQEFLDFREETLTRRYRYGLNQANDRLEVVEGLLTALTHLDQIIEILRQARDGTTAKVQLQVHFDLNDRQTDAILAMPLRRLTGIERENLEQEAQTLKASIGKLQQLLDDRQELLKSLKKDLRALKRTYHSPRRTQIHSSEAVAQATQELVESIAGTAIEAERCVLEFSQRGYVRRHSRRKFQRHISLDPMVKLEEGEDGPQDRAVVDETQEVLLLTPLGKAFTVKAQDLPPVSRRNPRGMPLITALPEESQRSPGGITRYFVLPADSTDLSLIALTRQGRIKRLPLADFQQLTNRGLSFIKLKDDDTLAFATIHQGGEQLVLATSKGRLLRFPVNDRQLPFMGRTAQGHNAFLRLRAQETLVGCVSGAVSDELLFVSAKGYVKRTPIGLIPQGNRGDLGTTAFAFTLKTDHLVAVQRLMTQAWVTVVTDQDRMARLDGSTVPVYGRDGGGDRLIQPQRDESIVQVSVMAQDLPD